VHDGGEQTSINFTATVADDGVDGALPATAVFTLNITPVNDAPTDITLTNTSIPENIGIGATVGWLQSIDADIPSDTFTYTLMSSPNNMFMISGNELIVNTALDFETLSSETITIRTDDGNGGIFDRMFTISVTDFDENPFVAASEEGGGTDTGVPLGLSERNSGIGGVSPVFEDILKTNNALYNTAFIEISQDSLWFDPFQSREAQNNNANILKNDGSVQAQGSGLQFSLSDMLQQPNMDEIQGEGDLEGADMSLKRALSFFTEIQTIQDYLKPEQQSEINETQDYGDDDLGQKGQSIVKKLSIEDQFADVLSYHVKQQQALRQALLQ
jgi:hypothetical protein